MLSDKSDILNCKSSWVTDGLKRSWAGQKDQGRKTPVLQNCLAPGWHHAQSTALFCHYLFQWPEAIRALKFIFLVLWAGSASGTNEVSRQYGRFTGRKPCKLGRGLFVNKTGRGNRAGPERSKSSHRVLSEETAEGRGTECQKPSPEKAGTSAVRGAPIVAKRNSLTHKSQGQLWKRTRGLTRAQTACVFTTLTQHTHSQAEYPEYTRKDVIICPLA